MKQTFVWDHAVGGYNDAQNFDLHRQMRQDLIDARRWAALWKAEAKMLREEVILRNKVITFQSTRLEGMIKKLAKLNARQCVTCSKYWGCKWAYHLDGCSEWEAQEEAK